MLLFYVAFIIGFNLISEFIVCIQVSDDTN